MYMYMYTVYVLYIPFYRVEPTIVWSLLNVVCIVLHTVVQLLWWYMYMYMYTVYVTGYGKTSHNGI